MTVVTEHASLTAGTADAVRRLVVSVPDSTDNPPVSEQGLLNLASGAVRHFLAEDAGSVTGYAQLDGTGAELVAADAATADVLFAELDRATAGGELTLWAHGAGFAGEAATAGGLRPVRNLLQLRRPLTDADLVDEPMPAGVTIRAFVPGQDDAGWLAVNAAAFAHHPEQGSWTQADLDDRIAADWFDPAGFLLAEREHRVIGFHWTKVHRAPGTEPLGEVYVLGVDPSAQGLRLGTLLLVAGLRHLRETGLNTVLLYVDEENATAVGLYRRIGFTEYTRDVQYAR